MSVSSGVLIKINSKHSPQFSQILKEGRKKRNSFNELPGAIAVKIITRDRTFIVYPHLSPIFTSLRDSLVFNNDRIVLDIDSNNVRRYLKLLLRKKLPSLCFYRDNTKFVHDMYYISSILNISFYKNYFEDLLLAIGYNLYHLDKSPSDIILLISRELCTHNVKDLISLALTCRSLYSLLNEERVLDIFSAIVSVPRVKNLKKLKKYTNTDSVLLCAKKGDLPLLQTELWKRNIITEKKLVKTALLLAVENCHLNVVIYLVKLCNDLDFAVDFNDFMVAAIKSGKEVTIDMVYNIFPEKTHIFDVDRCLKTALHYCHTDEGKRIFYRLFDPSSISDYGRYALKCLKKGHNDIFEYLYQSYEELPKRKTHLHFYDLIVSYAATIGRIDIINRATKSVVKKKFDIVYCPWFESYMCVNRETEQAVEKFLKVSYPNRTTELMR